MRCLTRRGTPALSAAILAKSKDPRKDTMMRKALLASAVLALAAVGAYAADPPNWMRQVTPGHVLDQAWGGYQAVYAGGALSAKTKQLIALGVSAQIPCTYCVAGHTQAARAAGATDDEIKEAVAVAGQVRMWSTMLNGSAYDMNRFQEEISQRR
jgi:AhpD family alkylhydroperoxidase